MSRGLLVVLPYPRRPESMFDGVEMPVVILSSYPRGEKQLATTRVGRMYGEERVNCLQKHAITCHDLHLHGHRIGKLHSELEKSIASKIVSARQFTRALVASGGDNVVFYQEVCRYWLKAQAGLPFFSRNGEVMRPPHGRVFPAVDKNAAAFFGCLLNSSLFYWYYSLFSDCEHVNDALVKTVPIPADWQSIHWTDLYEGLRTSLDSHAARKTIRTKQGHVIEYDEMKASQTKETIDQTDLALGRLYGLTDVEIDFIINYDIKYRMGSITEEEE